MEDWYEITMSSPELMDEFVKMIQEDDENVAISNHESVKLEKKRENAWVKKDKHRKDMERKFFSLNPGMGKEDLYPLPSTSCISVFDKSVKQGIYCINPVNQIYFTSRGHFEQFRGALELGGTGHILGLGSKDHDWARIMNRRIRHMNIREDDSCMKYSVYKKLLAPKRIGII